jgi:FkbM family methyltransferase
MEKCRQHRVEFSLFSEHPVLIDAGVCKGDFSNFVLKRFPTTRVIGFEACKPNFEALCKTDLFNKDNVVIYHKALTGENYPSSINFNDYPGFKDGGRGSIFDKQIDDRYTRFKQIINYEVSTINLHDVITEHGLTVIDMLKLDVECSEHDIIHTLRSDDAKIIKQISTEVHPIPGDPRTADQLQKELTRTLKEFGFKMTWFRGHGELYAVNNRYL